MNENVPAGDANPPVASGDDIQTDDQGNVVIGAPTATAIVVIPEEEED